MKMRSLVSVCIAWFVIASGVMAADVSLESLLTELTDRAAITAFPSPAFTCQQASSYDRASKSPTEKWFANGDTAQFVRNEMNGDRKEWVLMDTAGPGAIVRWWVTAPRYTSGAVFRIYLDGNATPAIEAPFHELIGGNALVGAPLSAERAKGRNLYLPIPYAKSCKVTVDKMDKQGNLYYQINYRTYPAGTEVESFTMDVFKAQQEKIASVQKALNDPNPPIADAKTLTATEKASSLSLAFGEASPPRAERPRLLTGPGPVVRGARGEQSGEQTARPSRRDNTQRSNTSSGEGGAVAAITLKFDAPEGELAKLSRNTLLEMQFDGQTTVLCPVGEFFGCGVGLNAYKSWYCTVEKDGTLRSRWVMPYQRGGTLTLRSADGNPCPYNATVTLETTSLPWTAERMYFHTNWRQERNIETIAATGTKDWEYIQLNGRGVFVGDVLSLLNRHTSWWGEGDEKIYVDGETFPSHFGTGTEDYYGYAWCMPMYFEAPFHAQPRAEGPNNYGHITNLRVRLLDSIPFTKDFRFDMEVWHWAATEIDYAVATFWYGRRRTVAVDAPNAEQVAAEASAPVSFNTPFTPKIKGFEVEAVSGGNISHQTLRQFGENKWRDNDQLWWVQGKPGDKLALKATLPKDGKQTLVVQCTKAPDYGVVQFWLDGKKVGEAVDFYNKGVIPTNVIPTGELIIGEVDAAAGVYTLEVEIIGKNEKSAGTMFGFDWFEFR